jgi:DNA-binding transcriptional ArsR family regulator
MPAAHSHRRSIDTARRALPDEPVVTTMAETFKVLGDPNRLRIVIALSHAELCTLDIARTLNMSESAVSHQLRLLKTLRLVRQRKDGRLVFTALDDEHIEDLLRIARRHASEDA